MTIRVVIADDHRVVRDGLCFLLGQEPGVEIVGEAGDGRRAVDVVAATRPDVLLLDLYMPELDGHAVIAALRDSPHCPAIVVLTSAADDEHLVRAMHTGATSYLLKTASAEQVIGAVRRRRRRYRQPHPRAADPAHPGAAPPAATGPARAAVPARARGTRADRPRPQQPADRP